MAVGKSISQNGEMKFFKLKLKGGAKFSQTAKDETSGSYVEVSSTRIINGALKKIETTSNDWNGDTIHTIKLTIKDTSLNETYVVDVSADTNIGRSVMSSLLNIAELGKIIELSLYSKPYTNRDGEKAKAENLYISYNGENLRWKYDMIDKTEAKGLPAVNTVVIKGKDTTDAYDRSLFLIKKVDEHSTSLGEAVVLDDMPVEIDSVITEPEESVPGTAEVKKEEEISIEDIPF